MLMCIFVLISVCVYSFDCWIVLLVSLSSSFMSRSYLLMLINEILLVFCFCVVVCICVEFNDMYLYVVMLLRHLFHCSCLYVLVAQLVYVHLTKYNSSSNSACLIDKVMVSIDMCMVSGSVSVFCRYWCSRCIRWFYVISSLVVYLWYVFNMYLCISVFQIICDMLLSISHVSSIFLCYCSVSLSISLCSLCTLMLFVFISYHMFTLLYVFHVLCFIFVFHWYSVFSQYHCNLCICSCRISMFWYVFMYLILLMVSLISLVIDYSCCLLNMICIDTRSEATHIRLRRY